jgi:hypothetical protein
LTRIPGASSSARLRVSIPSAAFADAYSAKPARGTCSWTLVTFTIAPPSPIRRAAHCDSRNAARTSIEKMASKSSVVRSSAGFATVTPALFTSASIRPSASAVSVTNRSGTAGSDRPPLTQCTRPRAERRSNSRAESSSRSCVANPSAQPSETSRSAMASPIPVLAPVTRTLRVTRR